MGVWLNMVKLGRALRSEGGRVSSCFRGLLNAGFEVLVGVEKPAGCYARGFCVVPSRVFLFQPKAAQGRNRPCAATATEDA